MNLPTDRTFMLDPNLTQHPEEMNPSAMAGIRRYGVGGMRLYLLIALAIEGIYSLYYIVKSKAFSFVDVGVDTFFCFYPLQVAVGRQLRELNNITWSFDLGLGGYLGTLLDPLWLVTALFPDSWQLALRLPLFLFKLLVGGAFFYGYLKVVGFRTALSVLGALAYAFSSYGITNAQWDLISGVEFVQFAGYLFLLETYLRIHRPWAAVCAGVIIGLGHPLGLYSFALLTVVYGLARMALNGHGGLSAYVGSFARFACWFVLGLLITAPILLPALYYFLESPRVSGEHSLLNSIFSLVFTLNDRTAFASEIAGLLGKDTLGTGSYYRGWGNYLEGPGFYVGILTLLCIPQLLAPQASRRERWFCIVGILAIAMYFIWPALRYAVYGFGHVVFRFSTLWISALLLIMGLAGLRRALDAPPWRTGIAVGVTGVLGIAFACVLLAPTIVNFKQIVHVIGFAAAYTAILCTAAYHEWRKQMVRPLLFLFACELMLFAMPALVERDAVAADGTTPTGRYNDATLQALAIVHGLERSGEFYRIEKTFDSVFLDDAMIQGYQGIKSYFFHATSVTRFVDRMGINRPTPSPNYIGSAVDRPGILDLVGVKYVLTRNRTLDGKANRAYAGSAGGVDVYRNDSAHTFGYFYDHIDEEAKADALAPVARDAFLLETAIVDDPGAIIAKLAALDRANAPEPILVQSAHLSKLHDDHVEGRIQVAKAKLLLISMPFDRGWIARLDGNVVDLFRADYGLTAVLIPAGTHALTLNYAPPGRRLGLWLSLASIGLLAGIRVFRRYLPALRTQNQGLSLRPSR
jgi:Bacterial membrane protein YfhO